MLRLVILAVFFSSVFSGNSFADTLYVDKSEIKIDTSFQGDVINLYGIKEDEGETIMILKGKKATYFVQKKEKKFGIWLKGKKHKFENIYRYYSIFSESTLDVMNIPYLLRPFEIGLENINTSSISVKDIIETFEYKDALFHKKILDGLFVEDYNKQVSTPENLVYAQFYIPKNIPEGDYVISVYTILNGEIQAISNIPIYIKQSGLLKFIKHTSTEDKGLYFLLSFGFSVGMALLGYILFNGKFFRDIRNFRITSGKTPASIASTLASTTVKTRTKTSTPTSNDGTPKKRGRPRKVVSDIENKTQVVESEKQEETTSL